MCPCPNGLADRARLGKSMEATVLIVDLERDESESTTHAVADVETAHNLMRELVAKYRAHWCEIEVMEDDSIAISIACNNAL